MSSRVQVRATLTLLVACWLQARRAVVDYTLLPYYTVLYERYTQSAGTLAQKQHRHGADGRHRARDAGVSGCQVGCLLVGGDPPPYP